MAATLRLLTAPSSMSRGALCCACDAWDGRKLRSCAWTSDAIDPRHAQCGKQNTAFNALGRQKLRSGPGSSGCNRTVAERAACHFISAHWLCARNGSDPCPSRLNQVCDHIGQGGRPISCAKPCALAVSASVGKKRPREAAAPPPSPGRLPDFHRGAICRKSQK